jgi:hypothetical protein
VIRNKAKPTSYLAFAAATLIKANENAYSVHDAERSGATRTPRALYYCTRTRQRTLPEAFSLCDSERIRVRLNSMDDLRSHSEVVHCALCRHWNGAAVKISTDTTVALILRVREGLNHG